MANSTHFETAKIYQFPLRTARTARAQRNMDAAIIITDRRFGRLAAADVVYDGGWYHDDAIKADRTPKS